MTFDPKSLPSGRTVFPTPTYFSESQFFGRSTDIERVKQFLSTGSSVAISGKRRIGRSWFLQHLRKALSVESCFTVYSDELKPDTIVPRHSRLFLVALIDALNSTLRRTLTYEYACLMLDPVNPPSNIGFALRTDLKNLHDVLISESMTAIILIDEIEAVYDFTDEAGIVPAIIKDLAEKYQNIRLVVAGFNLQSKASDQSSLFNAFSHHQLYGIGMDGAHQLIVAQLAYYEVSFESDEVWLKVCFLTGEEPLLVRLLGQQLVEQARNNNGVIGQVQIDNAVEDLFGMQQLSSIMNFAWAFLGDNQPIHSLATVLAYNQGNDALQRKKLLEATMHQFYPGQPAENIQNDLQRLRALGFLRDGASQEYSKFSSEFLRLWICRHRPHPGISV